MRTIVLLRKWPIRLEPIPAVGNDSKASRVDSMVLLATTTAHVDDTGNDLTCPWVESSMEVTRVPFVNSLVT